MTAMRVRVTLAGVPQSAGAAHGSPDVCEQQRAYDIYCNSQEVGKALAWYKAVCRDAEPLDGRTIRVVSVERVPESIGEGRYDG